jgi:hypothetical protein
VSVATGGYPHFVDHKADDGSDEEDSRDLLTSIMESIRLDLLSEYVSAVKRKLDRHGDDQKSDSFEPVTFGSPLFGSYHVLFPVEFSDGIRWLLKVPANGIRDGFDQTAPKALSSEPLTMQLLRRETTIPLPQIFTFDNSCDNKLNCPFILMNFISGKPLYDV